MEPGVGAAVNDGVERGRKNLGGASTKKRSHSAIKMSYSNSKGFQ